MRTTGSCSPFLQLDCYRRLESATSAVAPTAPSNPSTPSRMRP